MKEKQRKRLGEFLIDDGLLTKENLKEALEHQKSNGGLIGQIFIQLGYVSEEDLTAALGRQLKIPYIPLGQYAVNMDAIKLVDEDFCRKHMLIVFDADETKVTLALSDPLNDRFLDELKEKTVLRPNIFISTPTEINELLDLAFAKQRSTNKKAG